MQKTSFNFGNLIQAYQAMDHGETYPRSRAWEFLWDHINSVERWSTLATTRHRDLTALHLGFYLANWGMFRGSSQLMQVNLVFFRDMVEFLFGELPTSFWNLELCHFDFEDEDFSDTQKLFDETMASIEEFFRENLEMCTPTLLSKILLGVWGQCPALDTYFMRGLSRFLAHHTDERVKPRGHLRANTLAGLHRAASRGRWLVDPKARLKTAEGGHDYPPGKLIDMAFWRLGYE